MIRPICCSSSLPRQLFSHHHHVRRAATTTTTGMSNATAAAAATSSSTDDEHGMNSQRPTMGFDELFRRRETMKKNINNTMIGGEIGAQRPSSSSSSFRRNGGSGKPRHQHKRGDPSNNNNNINTSIASNYYHNDNQSSTSYSNNNLEQRARSHAQLFPIDSSSSSASQSISSWNRTTVEIIMSLSKLWGKDSRWHIQSTSEYDRKQLCKMVGLADELLHRLLITKMYEIDAVVDRMNETASSEHSLDDHVGDSITAFSLYHPTRINNDNKISNRGRIITKQQKALNTEILCSTVALGWSRCDPSLAIDAARKAEAILERLEDICLRLELLDNNNNNTATADGGNSRTLLGLDARDVTPSIKLYNHVLSCWSRSSDPIAEWRAKSLLDRMIGSAGDHDIGIGSDSGGTKRTMAFSRPDTFSYNNMLNLYANKGDAQSAEAMLLQMQMNNSVGGGGACADVYSYSIVINAFQKRFTSSGPNGRDRKDLARAEELLSTLATKYEQSGFCDTTLRPTNVTFGTIISMYAQADRMARMDPDGGELNGHKTRKWKATMLTKANDEEGNDVGWGAVNAERVLNWMIGLGERERLSKNAEDSSTSSSPSSSNINTNAVDRKGMICPTTYNFATVLDAWAKAGKGVEGARRCQALLDRLVSLYDKWDHIELRPIPLCFGTVIDAWCKADDRYESAEQAERVLFWMEDLFLHRKSSNPKEMLSVVAYNMVIDAWSRRSGHDIADRAENILCRLVHNQQLTNNRFLLPDAITYTAVMKAYVNHPHGGKKALAILKEMNDQCKSGNQKAKPDVRALAVAMDACAKSGLTSEAERILSDVSDMKKSEVLFNTVISGYKSEGRGLEADAVLRRMISLDKAGLHRCAPDLISYSLCITAWGNGTSRERVSRVKALLDESIQRYKGGDIKCRPSHVTFNSVAECIANSEDPEKETQVLAIFEQMEEIGCKPSLISFNILIKTCSSVTGNDERRRNALQIAMSAFDSIPSVGLRPDSITYTGMIHTILNLTEDSEERERANAITTIFRRCCEDGYLNQHILNVLSTSISEADYLSLTGATSLEEAALSSLPAEWIRSATKDSMAS